jgi:hypothetical protein
VMQSIPPVTYRKVAGVRVAAHTSVAGAASSLDGHRTHLAPPRSCHLTDPTVARRRVVEATGTHRSEDDGTDGAR